MAAPKGHKGYKPKGAVSAKTVAWNKLGDFITGQGAERLKRILSELDDVTFMKVYIQLIEYFKPKQSRIEPEKFPEKHTITVSIIGDDKKPSIKLPDGNELEI